MRYMTFIKREARMILGVILAVMTVMTFTACGDTEVSVPDTQMTVSDTTDNNSEKASHVHSFSAATCIEPSTCICGVTEGEKGEHDWLEATCVLPERCSVCGEYSGEALGHDYVSGICSRCDAREESNVMVWIPTMGGQKYHFDPECSDMNGPIQVTMEEAEEQGFTPCKRCFDF